MATNDNTSNEKSLIGIKKIAKFGDRPETWIDAYVVPELYEVRFAPTAMSVFVGRSENYLSRLTKTTGKSIERLRSNGFNDLPKLIKIAGTRQTTKSLSCKDFEAFVTTEAQGKDANPVALAHLAASFAVRLAEIEAKLLTETLGDGAAPAINKEAVYGDAFTDYLEAFQRNQDDWDAIAEQEEYAISDHALLFDGSDYIPLTFAVTSTATGYHNDPDCYQPAMN